MLHAEAIFKVSSAQAADIIALVEAIAGIIFFTTPCKQNIISDSIITEEEDAMTIGHQRAEAAAFMEKGRKKNQLANGYEQNSILEPKICMIIVQKEKN